MKIDADEDMKTEDGGLSYDAMETTSVDNSYLPTEPTPTW